MAEVVGFHLNRGVLAAARRPAELTVPDVLAGARTVAVLEGVNDHENLGSIFRNAAGLGVDAVIFGAGCADPLYRRLSGFPWAMRCWFRSRVRRTGQGR